MWEFESWACRGDNEEEDEEEREIRVRMGFRTDEDEDSERIRATPSSLCTCSISSPPRGDKLTLDRRLAPDNASTTDSALYDAAWALSIAAPRRGGRSDKKGEAESEYREECGEEEIEEEEEDEEEAEEEEEKESVLWWWPRRLRDLAVEAAAETTIGFSCCTGLTSIEGACNFPAACSCGVGTGRSADWGGDVLLIRIERDVERDAEDASSATAASSSTAVTLSIVYDTCWRGDDDKDVDDDKEDVEILLSSSSGSTAL